MGDVIKVKFGKNNSHKYTSEEKTIFRVKHNTNYTCLSNSFINDIRLDDATIGFLARIFAKPDNWKFTVTGYVNEFKTGRDKVYKLLNKTEKLGYSTVIKSRGKYGQYSKSNYQFFEDSSLAKPKSLTSPKEKPDPGLPEVVKPIHTKQLVQPINKVTTTNSSPLEEVSSSLDFHKSFTEEEIATINPIFSNLEGDLAQKILYETAANIESGTIRKDPITFIRALVKLARKGDFNYAAGLRYERNLKAMNKSRHRIDKQIQLKPELPVADSNCEAAEILTSLQKIRVPKK